MRGYFENDFFGPRFGGMFGPIGCHFRGDFPGHHGPWSFEPFGRSFDHSPSRNGHHHHGPEHQKRGPPADGHQGPRCHRESDSDSDGPANRHCHRRPSFRGCGGRHHDHHGPEHQKRGPPADGNRGPRCHRESDSDSDDPVDRHCHRRPGFRGCGGRHRDFPGHGPSCHSFGRRGPFEIPDRPWRGPWEGPWGADRHMYGFGRHGPRHPWFGHRRPCPYSSEEHPSRKCDCKKSCENRPCCSKNKENRGHGKERKENEASCDKDQDVGDTVFVQRIVLEKTTRPQSA